LYIRIATYTVSKYIFKYIPIAFPKNRVVIAAIISMAVNFISALALFCLKEI